MSFRYVFLNVLGVMLCGAISGVFTCAEARSNDALDAELITAAELGDLEIVQTALADGAWVNAQDGRGRTAMMVATHGNHPQVVAALINAGGDVNLQDQRLDNPFLYAGAEGLAEILTLTIDARADTRITNRFGGTALIPAAERGHVDVARELLSRTDININHVNNLGWTALLEAIVLSNGGPSHQLMVQLLVDYGADVNIPDKSGVTPLQHARTRGFGEIARILVEAGAR